MSSARAVLEDNAKHEGDEVEDGGEAKVGAQTRRFKRRIVELALLMSICYKERGLNLSV